MRLAEAEASNRLRADYAGLALIFAELAGCRNEWHPALEGWNVRRSQQVLEWQAEAAMEVSRAHILRVLQVRFGTEVPADLAAAVQGLADQDELAHWFELALKAESLDAFRAAIQHGRASMGRN